MDSSTKKRDFHPNGSKLMRRANGPFEIIERINDNAYKVDLPSDYGVSATFNVADLSSYLDDNYLEDLRKNSSSQGENDGGLSLFTSYGPSKSQRGWKDTMSQAQQPNTDRSHHKLKV